MDQLDEDEREDSVWWKCKKWCLHIFAKVFDRYGTPGEVSKGYQTMAKFFVAKLAKNILQSVFALLNGRITGRYVSSRCLQLSLTYIRQALKVSGIPLPRSKMDHFLRESIFMRYYWTDASLMFLGMSLRIQIWCCSSTIT